MTIVWLAYWVVLTYLLLEPRLPRAPFQLSRRGLVAHFVTFALLTAGCHLAGWARRGVVRDGSLAAWAMLFVAYGGLVELLQPYMQRDGDWRDCIANAAGVIVATIVIRWLTRPRPAPTRSASS